MVSQQQIFHRFFNQTVLFEKPTCKMSSILLLEKPIYIIVYNVNVILVLNFPMRTLILLLYTIGHVTSPYMTFTQSQQPLLSGRLYSRTAWQLGACFGNDRTYE